MNNRERAQENHRSWWRRNPEQVRTHHQRRRARRLSATTEIFTQSELHQYWIANDINPNECVYCGGPHEHDDHVIPLARGGAHERANLLPSCATCNGSKGTQLLEEWQPKRFAAA